MISEVWKKYIDELKENNQLAILADMIGKVIQVGWNKKYGMSYVRGIGLRLSGSRSLKLLKKIEWS